MDRNSLEQLRNGNMMVDGNMDPPRLFFPGFEKTGLVRHAFSTRLGGVSGGFYSSLNFGRGTETTDTKENITENFRRMAEALGTTPDRMVLSNQRHTTNIRRVTEEDAGKGIVRDRDYNAVDGLITDLPGMTLVTVYADCVPLFFLDPVKRVIALSHSGWRGTAARMGAVTVRRMEEEYGCDPGNILAGIGPSICRDCYEVDRTVYEGFSKSFPEEDLERIFFPGRAEHWQLDLWLANRIILEEAGLRPDHIETAKLCTCCNSGLLFSHRATGGKRGLLGAFLSLCDGEA